MKAEPISRTQYEQRSRRAEHLVAIERLMARLRDEEATMALAIQAEEGEDTGRIAAACHSEAKKLGFKVETRQPKSEPGVVLVAKADIQPDANSTAQTATKPTNPPGTGASYDDFKD